MVVLIGKLLLLIEHEAASEYLQQDPKTLTDVLETNFVMRFYKLTKDNVIIGTYKTMKERYGYNNLETMQELDNYNE